MTGQKLALCIGINYPGTSNQLSGCVNDATDWADLLQGEGYDVSIVLDNAATKENILTQLRDTLAAASSRYDRVVVTYSGHGTWVPDQNGDEIDGRDEALVPVDFRSSNLIIDDELADVMAGAKTSAVLMLSDSCFSGTVARFAALTGVPSRGTPRFLPPDQLFDSLTPEKAAEAEKAIGGTPRPFNSLISGCSDLEYSYDAWFANRPNGAFTRTALDSWQAGVSLAGWFKKIRETLPSEEYPQTPQLTAASSYRRYARAI